MGSYNNAVLYSKNCVIIGAIWFLDCIFSILMIYHIF